MRLLFERISPRPDAIPPFPWLLLQLIVRISQIQPWHFPIFYIEVTYFIRIGRNISHMKLEILAVSWNSQTLKLTLRDFHLQWLIGLLNWTIHHTPRTVSFPDNFVIRSSASLKEANRTTALPIPDYIANKPMLQPESGSRLMTPSSIFDFSLKYDTSFFSSLFLCG